MAEARADKLGLKDPKVRENYVNLAVKNKFDSMSAKEKMTMIYKYYKLRGNRKFMLKSIVKAGPEVEKEFINSPWYD